MVAAFAHATGDFSAIQEFQAVPSRISLTRHRNNLSLHRNSRETMPQAAGSYCKEGDSC